MMNCQLTKEFRQILDENPDGLWACSLSSLYKTKFGKTLDMHHMGYFSLGGMLANFDDVFACRRLTEFSDWMLFDARKDISVINELERKARISSGKPPTLPRDLKEQVVKFLKKFPKGMYIEDFFSNFKFYSEGRVTLPESLGFSSMLAVLQYLKDDVISLTDIDLDSTPNIIVKLPERFKRFGEVVPFFPDEVDEIEEETTNIPDDAVLPGELLIIQNLAEECTIGSIFEAITMQIVDPEEFYVMFKGEATSEALNKVMTFLSHVYCFPDGERYHVPEKFFRVGLLCATVCTNDLWNRAVVIEITTDKKYVKVFYVDYGTIADVKKIDVRLLKRKFVELPAQAIEAKLSGINLKSPDSRWSQAAINRFYELAGDRCLEARLIRIDTSTKRNIPVLVLDLMDPNQGLNINQSLILEGFAKNNAPSVNPGLPITSPMIPPTSKNMFAALHYAYVMALSQANYVAKMVGTATDPNVDLQENCVVSAPANGENIEVMGMTDASSTSVSSVSLETAGSAVEMQTAAKHPSNYELPSDINEHRCTSSTSLPLIARMRIMKEKLKRRSISASALTSTIGNDVEKLIDKRDRVSDNTEEKNLKTKNERFVKIASLTPECTVHLILYNKALYLSSREISALFWKRDLLWTKLRRSQMKLPFVLINDHDEPSLFAELLHYKLCTTLEDQPTTLLMYPLTCLTKLIRVFGSGMIDLKQAVEDEISRFEDNAKYMESSDDGIGSND